MTALLFGEYAAEPIELFYLLGLLKCWVKSLIVVIACVHFKHHVDNFSFNFEYITSKFFIYI